MSSLRWQALDDRAFVYLVADLLARLGFVDIQIHGEGPDGGLDLIASEPLRFAIQGTRLFPWGIQCKFSKSGIKKAVSDHEVRDVEGIIRSDRYSTHRLRGYMVVTNRRVSQNVVERLGGIDRRSPYRTAYLDGEKLGQYLKADPALIDKHFGAFSSAVARLGASSVAGQLQDDSGLMTVPVMLWADDPKKAVRVDAVLGIGVTRTAMPGGVLDRLQPQALSDEILAVVSGKPLHLESFLVNLRIGGTTFANITVHSADRAVLGWNVLSQTALLLDIPSGIIAVWARNR